jgi:hypothetical protein
VAGSFDVQECDRSPGQENVVAMLQNAWFIILRETKMQRYFSSRQEFSYTSNSWKAPRTPSLTGNQASSAVPLTTTASRLLRQRELDLDKGSSLKKVGCRE